MSAKYTLIDAEKAESDIKSNSGARAGLSVARMCTLLAVSTSGFYEWLTRGPSARDARRALVAEHVAAAFEHGRGTYGFRRVHAIVARCNDPAVASASPKLVRSIMRELGLHACQPRAWRTTTVNDGGGAGIVDHLQRDFTAAEPGVKLVGDITYVRTWEGWLYLATVIDCHSRAVVGWSMAEHMRTDLICDALTMAAANIDFTAGAVFHSDRGTQYTSAQFADHLKGFDLTASMGSTGVCWDNALAESFFAALKNELVHRHIFPTRKSARTAIAGYIEMFYNRLRIHSTLGYKTPHQVMTEHQQQTPLAA